MMKYQDSLKKGNGHRIAYSALALMVILLFSGSFPAAAKTAYRQTKGLTLSFRGAPIERVFDDIERQSPYRIQYDQKQMNKAVPVTINVKNAAPEVVFRELFSRQPFRYRVDGNRVIVQPLSANPDENKTQPLDSTLPVNGTVTFLGAPLPGATVKVKNSHTGVTTDPEGRFTIMAAKGNTLVISFIGFQQQFVRADLKGKLEIKMQVEVNKLDEAVAIGYGSTSQRYNTGSVSKVTAEQIGNQPVSNPLAALQGRAAGIFINTRNGLPGGDFSVQIRGINSIAGGKDPLYIIDGVPLSMVSLNETNASLTTTALGSVSALNNLNPSDILSIEVLKDADATAIYGSRAANGVVLITTKASKTDESKFELNFYQGYSEAARLPKMLGLKDYLMLRNEAFSNDGLSPSASQYSPNYAPDLMEWDTTQSTDWVKYLLGGKASVSNAQLSYSGGTATTRFYISGNYRKEGTIFPDDFDYTKANAHISVNHTSVNQKLNIIFTGNFNTDHNNQIAFPVISVLSLAPNFPLKDAEGRVNWNYVSVNPLALLDRKMDYKNDGTLLNTTIKYNILPNLSFKTNLGYNNIHFDQRNIFPVSSLDPTYVTPQNYAQFGSNQVTSYIIEPQLDYRLYYKKQTFSALLGATYQQNTASDQFVKGSNYSNEALLKSINGAGVITEWYGNSSTYKYASMFGRLTYDLSHKYLFNATVRRDGSSRFGPGKQYGNFWSVGGGWLWSQESFIKNHVPFISYGKLRSSYGLTGNDQIGDYQYLSLYTPGSPYQGNATLRPSRIFNSAFGWETTKKFEVGLELGIHKDQTLLTLNYYRTNSNNQLIPFPLPYLSGPFGSYQANLPARIRNTGFEVEIISRNIDRAGFKWVTSFNITLPKNELVEFPGIEKTSFANSLVIGEDLGIQRGYQFSGLSPETGLRLYNTPKGTATGTPVAPGDYFTLGKLSPYYYGGLSNTLQYKGFNLDLFFQFTKQYLRGGIINPGALANTYEEALNRWRQPGDEVNTNIRKATTAYDFVASQSNLTFINGTYMRLKSLTLSYSFGQPVRHSLNLQNMRVYLEGQNLFTLFKPAAILDPETGDNGIPPMRSIVGGIQLTF